MPTLTWEKIDSAYPYPQTLARAKVPGGWLLLQPGHGSITFYPDPNHEWDGNSLP